VISTAKANVDGNAGGSGLARETPSERFPDLLPERAKTRFPRDGLTAVRPDYKLNQRAHFFYFQIIYRIQQMKISTALIAVTAGMATATRVAVVITPGEDQLKPGTYNAEAYAFI
jgi:hypothetical protein